MAPVPCKPKPDEPRRRTEGGRHADPRRNPTQILEKLDFSAAADGALLRAPGGDRRQFVVCGSEAHVCVLQTVLDLLGRGREVFVVEEAIGSRRPSDKALAVERMRQAGAMIVSREMVAFEWMERAGSDRFREISRNFIR